MYKNKYYHHTSNGDNMKKQERNKINKDILDELNKGACMGMDAIRDILEKVEDKKFKKILEDGFDKYKMIHRRIEEKYEEYSKENPTETSTMNKAMTSMMTDMKLMTDHSDSKIAELLLQGTNMGIIEGRKLLNNKENIDKEVESILKDFIKMQEESVEIYKEYL